MWPENDRSYHGPRRRRTGVRDMFVPDCAGRAMARRVLRRRQRQRDAGADRQTPAGDLVPGLTPLEVPEGGRPAQVAQQRITILPQLRHGPGKRL